MQFWYRSGEALVSEIRNTQLGPDMLALWYLGQCGYAVKHQSTVLLIDPVLNDLTSPDGSSRRHYPAPFAPDGLEPDIVLCTHAHADHMAPPTLRAIAGKYPGTQFVLPAGCAELGASLGLGNIQPLVPGQTLALSDGLAVSALSTAHPDHIHDSQNPAMSLAYCLTLGGIRLLHLGDTYLTEPLLKDLEALEPPHIFLPPINGSDCFRDLRNCIGNLEAEEAAKLAAHLHADLTLPTHFDMVQNNTVDPLRFAAELRRICPSAKWQIPALGERILYAL